jgi:hypothetical protein
VYLHVFTCTFVYLQLYYPRVRGFEICGNLDNNSTYFCADTNQLKDLQSRLGQAPGAGE